MRKSRPAARIRDAALLFNCRPCRSFVRKTFRGPECARAGSKTYPTQLKSPLAGVFTRRSFANSDEPGGAGGRNPVPLRSAWHRDGLVMNFCGISDSFASLASQNPPCPECASTSRVAKGLCLRCLFSCGLLAGEAETESLD